MNDNLAITSSSNPKFKELFSIKEKGKDLNLVLIEGEDLVDLAIVGKKLIKIVCLEEFSYRYKEYPQISLSRELYRRLSSYNSLPKIMGVASFSFSTTVSDKIIYLDGIQDPGNLGTIMRSCLAFGFSSLALSKDCVSPFNFKCVQASKGAFFNLSISHMELKDLKSRGYKLVMTLLDGEDISKVSKPDGKFALIIGSEGKGIRKESIDLADMKVKLPINPVIDSLNAAIAASIFMFLWKD